MKAPVHGQTIAVGRLTLHCLLTPGHTPGGICYRLDDPQQPIAATWRQVGLLAEELDLPRPGYDTIRLIVRSHRRQRSEIQQLLEPVVSDFLQGRVSAWDVEQVVEAVGLEANCLDAAAVLARYAGLLRERGQKGRGS